MRADWLQPGNAIDDIDCQVKTIDLIENCELQWSINVPLFLVSADMNIFMVPAAIGEFMDQCCVGVEVENDGFVCREQRVEVAVREPVRMFRLRHEPEEVHDIDEPDFQIGE